MPKLWLRARQSRNPAAVPTVDIRVISPIIPPFHSGILNACIHADDAHPGKCSGSHDTFINIYRQQGKLPVWHLMGDQTDCMVGNPGIPVLADLVLKGYVKDKEGAYEAMKQSALREDRGLSFF